MVRFRKMKVDGIGSESSPTVNVGVSSLETSCSVTMKVEGCVFFQVLSNLAHICARMPLIEMTLNLSSAIPLRVYFS